MEITCNAQHVLQLLIWNVFGKFGLVDTTSVEIFSLWKQTEKIYFTNVATKPKLLRNLNNVAVASGSFVNSWNRAKTELKNTSFELHRTGKLANCSFLLLRNHYIQHWIKEAVMNSMDIFEFITLIFHKYGIHLKTKCEIIFFR